MEDLIQVLRRVSEMVCELPEIRALDINPLIADAAGVLALDARVEIQAQAPGLRRYQHMAIHPYPAHLVSGCQLADGTRITIRPIRPEDAAIEQNFVRSLSSESRHFRFMHGLNELTQPMLVRFTHLDYDRELALIAVQENAEVETELGVARYVMNTDGESCEFALVVADEWQNRGIGTALMQALIEAARQRGFKRIEGEILTENTNMRALVEKLGFSVDSNPAEMTIVLAAKLL
jgi:acetyltransferase